MSSFAAIKIFFGSEISALNEKLTTSSSYFRSEDVDSMWNHNITITFICMTIIIYSIAKGTLKQEQQEKEIIIMILITDNQVTSFLDDRILSRKLFNNEI